jgi:hypothetical protein
MVIPEDFLAALQQDPAAQVIPRFLRDPETAAVVHHLLPAHQRQAAGDAREAHGRVIG